MGFYSFGFRAAKKILINSPKSFHDWKMKFFFIREEVIPIVMIFRESDKTEKEELPIPKTVDWYMRLLATSNMIFGEQVLVAAGMSDKWPARSKEVPVLMFEGEVAQLYQSTFPTFGGAMGVRPLGDGEVFWYEQIKNNFLYPLTGIFANPPTSTKGAQLPKPRPLRGVTSAGKEILYLSSEESVRSSNEKLSSWSNIFAGVLRDLRIDPGEKPKKAPTKKKTNTRKRVDVDTGATSKKAGGSRATVAVLEKGTFRFRPSNLEDYVVSSDSLEGLSRIGEKKSSAAASKSSGSAESRAPEFGATPSSLHEEEEEEEEEVEEEGVKLVTRKRSREETTAGTTPPAQQAAATQPIGKQGRLRSLYKFSPEALKKAAEKVKGPELKKAKEQELKKTKFVIIPPKTTTEKEAENRVEEPAGDVIPEKVAQVAHQDTSATAAGTGAGGSGAASQKGVGKKIPRPRSPIGAEDTLGDIYYKTYTEEQHGEEKHVPVWSLKQKDTFVDFGTCRDWFLGTFPPGEVNRQRARNHEGLYHAYIVGEANTAAANHQIVHEWRTIYKERASWEKYRERLLTEAREFEQMKNNFLEEKASFEKEKKSEEWGVMV
ncbi:hypothetical protein HanRHA438_Chr06g0275511 [Helianthus annuus]|uniref:Uncharacterized protein n=1 Tax=Helianthus annuus TaxID=4232 RepID=A0A9K3IU57_HELAN|nr:hypothetical protein HanXRQr2_Chr06g0266441 [Helianthus annuus]KAJ0574088.1 hypothetical protein HanHA89_Chr06g0234211 [Helianthus annuus]KAJ0738423.1 hypothetical protein HanLR1_Chr06g0218141 [Helianthus annuus]KAJ0741311.1 hypothetical protein HanOQP8_Chr06g0226651 [Helianthus annuus]KAJ0912542.1 hypothetical protein HanRHA438_Chr06g0275511 [Helianthus annuus]